MNDANAPRSLWPREGRPRGSTTEMLVVLIAVSGLMVLIDHNFWISTYLLPQSGTSSGLAAGLASIEEGSAVRRLTIVLAGLLGIWLLVFRRRPGWKWGGALAGLAAVFLVWSTASLMWADDVAFTFRRVGSLWLLVAAAMGVAAYVPRRSLVWFVLLSGIAYIFMGVGTELYLGTFDPLRGGYRFSGTRHPNAQGVNCALAALSGLWLTTRSRGRTRSLAVALAVTAVLFLVLTRSRTSFAAFLGSALLLAVLTLRPNVRLLGLTAGVNAVLAVGMLYVGGLVPLPAKWLLLGRSDQGLASLSERLPLWEILGSYVEQRPMLGYGYAGFMTPRHGAEVGAMLEFGISAAHSIYLELLLGVGAVGLAIFLMYLLVGLARCSLQAARGENATSAFFAAVLAFEMLNGILDSSLLFPSWRLTTLILLVALCLRPDRRAYNPASPAVRAAWPA